MRKKPDRYVKVFDSKHQEVHRRRAKPDDAIVAILVIDESNKVLYASQWDVRSIQRQLDDLQKAKASPRAVGKSLLALGSEDGRMINTLILERLGKLPPLKELPKRRK